MAKQWDVPAIDTKAIKENSKLTLDGGFDFNSGWNHHFRRQYSRSSIENEMLVPPEGFKLYYKEHNSQTDLGILVIWADENKKEVGILFYTTPESLKGQIYNESDLTNFTKEEFATSRIDIDKVQSED